MLDRYDIRIEDLPPDFKEIAEAIGLSATLQLVAARGGEGVYVPKAEKIARKARNRAIRAEFDGVNHRELARRHNLTVVMIRNIVQDNPSGKSGPDVVEKQLSLF